MHESAEEVMRYIISIVSNQLLQVPNERSRSKGMLLNREEMRMLGLVKIFKGIIDVVMTSYAVKG